jgi:hypothetical protein
MNKIKIIILLSLFVIIFVYKYKYKFNMTLFEDIIEQQINLKHKYKSEPRPETECICIIIKDNKIEKIIHGKRFHQSRERLYVSLINNVLEKYTINDCNININLCDIPKVGYFNFCREKNNHSQFLLPNHRFTTSDIKVDENEITFKNFNEEKSYILSKHIHLVYHIEVN